MQKATDLISKTLPQDIFQKISAMPKTEIHVHLEGAQPAQTIWDMAQRNGAALPVKTFSEFEKFYQFTDFKHFIEVYILCTTYMQKAEDYFLMVDAFLAEQKRQNIVYSEVFLSASLQLTKLPQETLIDVLVEAVKNAQAKHGVHMRLIPDISRESPQTQHKVYSFVEAACKKSDLFLGLGLGGIEDGFPPALFVDTYAKARAQGLKCVVHAGEAAGAQSVKEAVGLLKAQRIGHGIRSIESAEVCAELKEKNIPIEVCPVSNYRTQVVKKGEAHPIRKMLELGLNCTVNSDDPAMFSTTLTDEYLVLASQGFSWEELWQLNLNTLEATFLPKAEKEKLKQKWNEFKQS